MPPGSEGTPDEGGLTPSDGAYGARSNQNLKRYPSSRPVAPSHGTQVAFLRPLRAPDPRGHASRPTRWQGRANFLRLVQKKFRAPDGFSGQRTVTRPQEIAGHMCPLVGAVVCLYYQRVTGHPAPSLPTNAGKPGETAAYRSTPQSHTRSLLGNSSPALVAALSGAIAREELAHERPSIDL